MSKSATVKQNQGYLSTLPLGSIIAWHRDIDPDNYVPPLPPGWAECNGQVLDDPESILHNQKIPNLNNEGRFLRGNNVSGGAGGSVTHDHSFSQAYDRDLVPDASHYTSGSWTNPSNHLPPYFNVIWIMKIKQVMAAAAVAAVAAESNAPHGAVYVSKDGNVGIGTSTPVAKLHVNGPLEADGITGLTFITETPPDFRDTNITSSRGWISTPHTISLDSAGAWLVLYTVRVFRNAGDRADMSMLHLTTNTGGTTGERSFPGVSNATIQTSGTINVTHVFIVTGPDTVTVEVKDGTATASDLDLNSAHFTAIRLR